LSKQTLAEIVKSKRDALQAKKIGRELAKKKKEREERKRIAAAAKAKELARVDREKKKLMKAVADKKAATLRQATIKKVLNVCLLQAIDGNNLVAANNWCLNYREDFEQLGFLFFNQIEHTQDVATLRIEKKHLSAMKSRQFLEIASLRSTLDRYLNINSISEKNYDDFRSGLTALKEFIYKSDDLQADIDDWVDMKELSPGRIREIYPAFSNLSDAMTVNAIEKNLVFANRRYHEREQWEINNRSLLTEMRIFSERSMHSLSQYDLTEKKLEDVKQSLSEDEETNVTYMSWEKKPTSKSFSNEYRKLNWFCSRASKALFTQISEYLIRNATKSEVRLKLKISETDEGHKLTIGREIILVPNFVDTPDLAKKIKAFGFNVVTDPRWPLQTPPPLAGQTPPGRMG
jgi:hypothetical protein